MLKKIVTRAAVVAAAAALTFGAAVGTANANTDPRLGYVGDNQANNTHAVWCVQKMFNDWRTMYYNDHWAVAQDGIWGPHTREALEAFQGSVWNWGDVPKVDGIVGPTTGTQLIEHSGSGYAPYCNTYLPTNH
ncbi:hypothetical protein QMK19_06705 [Streptomyces sp. H10-C2]|uniref:peptidoglycan-binding domain-containing protein n=1 Tax=unclassified Streptomyces TaxID=2593676 RepID=UPI0024BB52F9|nr:MULTISPECIES: hypothetical protein [unclassified Streptomyces]MDJ0339989.1 hypothetical protein [Streptomyces sp. PH10-H1]MDJ0369374.1 hypothetical protein [Streptomyces sp. H10-C2]